MAPKIRVRGATSIYGSSKPLWVVDGVIMEDVVEVSADELSSGNAETLISSAIAGLNADDIESFQILKDGSATSIYGARAMAGVIVVTTKKGKAGQRPDHWRFDFDNPQFLILNLAIGGVWGGEQGIDDSIFPVKYYVDWVRYYK